jgi:hypothetical protein
MNIDLKEYKAALEELTRNLGYGTVYFKPDLKKIGQSLQVCSVEYKKKYVNIPKNPNLNELYCFAHEIGHIRNNINDTNNNTEENAWEIALTICREIGLPLDDFEKVKNLCLDSY